MNPIAVVALALGALAAGFILLTVSKKAEMSAKALTALVCVLSNAYVFDQAWTAADKVPLGWLISAAVSGTAASIFVVYHIFRSLPRGGDQQENLHES